MSDESTHTTQDAAGADTPEATPAAEALAEAAGVDLAEVDGSGADGRIVKADVEADIDPETDTANEAAVEAFENAEPADEVVPELVGTIGGYDTLSGYAPDSYPEAQARGEQFDKPGEPSPIETGKQAEAREHSQVVEVDAGPDDSVGKDVEEQDAAAREADASDVQNVKLGNADKNPETA